MQKNTLITISMLVIYSITYAPLIFAEMYKWVDEEGNTHYTQSPPSSDIEVHIIKPPSSVDTGAAQKSLIEQKKKADTYLENRKKQEAELSKKEAEEEKISKNCEISRSNVAKLERPRIQLNDEQGNTYNASEDERLERLRKAQEDVEEYCN